MQISFAQRIKDEGWSVRQTERQVQDHVASEDQEPLSIVGTATPAPKSPARDSQLASLEQELRHAIGTRVDIRQNTKGRGKITIHVTSHEEFERIRDLLTDSSRPQSAAG